ncbi:hypothetical protein [Vallitalea okinawensis]|uniref:hypothetical protein n=1 Tax=Vallitalea okinawensis TaxID=2078660 RepID=UPI000CFD4D0E|nr:hypothetical protein [Vallitalea okinawensis]
MLLNGKNIALLGILLAINQVFLYLASIIESNTLIFLFAAALIIGVVVVETEIRSSWMFFITSCLLAFFLVPNKFDIAIYIMILGPYSILKELIERHCFTKNTKGLEIGIKLVTLNLLAILSYFIMRYMLPLQLNIWLIIIGEVLLLCYDYVFGYFIHYYIKHIRNRIK